MMEQKSTMRYVDTNTASVKITSGIPFTVGSPVSDDSCSTTEDEFVNYQDYYASKNEKHKVEVHGRNPSRENVDRTENISGHLQNKNINEKHDNHISPKCLSDTELVRNRTSSSQKITPGGMKIGQSNSNINTAYESSSNFVNSSSQKMNVKTDNNKNVTSPYVLKSRQTVSRSDSRDKLVPDISTLKTTNLKNCDYIQDVINTKKMKERAVDKSYSSKPDRLSLDNTSEIIVTTSSSRPRDDSQTARLSQSLENSQEGVMKLWESSLVASNSMSAISNFHKDKLKTSRVNPFNNSLLIDEDHFSDSYDNYFRTDRRSNGSTKSSSISQGADWWQEQQSDVSFAELGLSEDHFSHPQGHFGLSRAEELELAIENCKELIQESVQGSDKQKNLVLKLVQLRIKLQDVKEGPEPTPDNVKVILSHKMMLKNSRSSKYYCERCNGAIWGMIQAWYKCTECGYTCHEKCLQQILRTCAKAKVLENPTLVTDICPKEANGLASQNYRCWECRLAISFKNGHSEPRLCDYTGRYYCQFCHWNDTYVIPARVLHNWDFIPRKVCRASKQYMKLMQKKAAIRIQDINPMLFVYVDQLNEIKKLREEMMVMKKYILSCVSAMSAKLLLLLSSRQHFVESSDKYSMQDLLDAENVLLPELVSIHSTWAKHIKVDCQLCQGRGFCCELCGEKEVLFPFDSTAVVCPKCFTVLHRHCYAKAFGCPRCERREKRKSKET